MQYARRMDAWPSLPYRSWKETSETLRLWMQIVGKVRLVQSPWVNHQWHVTLYVTARGLTTSPIPHGTRIFEMVFDFLDHRLRIRTSDGDTRALTLQPQSVSTFYHRVMALLDELELPVTINRRPNEVPEAVPFDEDDVHRAYDPDYAQRFWRALVQADRVFKVFRGRFTGKCSPVHFFWGSFDLAVSRFNGSRAPQRPDADAITREAYSHEVISAGFWPGGAGVEGPAFYSYTVPEPPGYSAAAVRPAAAFYHSELREFLLMYDEVRGAESPRQALLDFLQTTYEAGANLARWDRNALEIPSAA